MYKILLSFFFLFLISLSQESRTIEWLGVDSIMLSNKKIKLLDFNNSAYNIDVSQNKFYYEKIPVNSKDVHLDVFDLEFVNISSEEESCVTDKVLLNKILLDYYVVTQKKQHYLVFCINPFQSKNNLLQKITSFKLKITDDFSHKSKIDSSIKNSILHTGNWYKIAVTQDGIYEIDASFLNSIGVDISEINPHDIRLYGNRAGVLEEGLITVDDLTELSILVQGEDDGVFNDSDKILFFGQSPHTWNYDGQSFFHTKNIYSDSTYYFLSFDLGPGKRIESSSVSIEMDSVDKSVSYYDAYFFHENDLTNLVSTGRQWFGESFSFNPNQEFNYNAEYIDLSEPVDFTVRVAARSSIVSSFNITNNTNFVANLSVPYVSSSTNDYYKSTISQGSFNPISTDLSLTFSYAHNGNSSALAWLDYFRLVFRNKLVFDGEQFVFRDSRSVGEGILSEFFIDTDFTGFNVWDVTDPMHVHSLPLIENNDTHSFIVNTDSLKEFLIFNQTDNLSPDFSKVVTNQNIHGSNQVDYIIVTHPDFLNAANRLKDFHIENNDKVLLVTTEQVYNEFSTGAQDISAIRSLVKMFYDRSVDEYDMPKNLLLFGDASFDYKNKLSSFSNYVPTYESYTSSSIESSYCTDDYFGVLDDNEGAWLGGVSNGVNIDLVDIGIGRIPVNSIESAESFVDKILLYNSNSSYGSWKNKICFVADDIDASWEVNLITHADALAQKIDTTYDYFNLDKIYLDSYQQLITSGSQRYPEAQEDLVNLINSGVFLVNYVGHGGEVGWASERILELPDINGFNNLDRLPVFITATCEFTRYDDPDRVSAGEYLLLNPNGGAIGLYSTSRTVSEAPTYYLVNSLYDYLPDRNANLTFGESLMYCKNNSSLGFNSVKRKFSFFGDPNLRLSHPIYNVNTVSVELIDSLNQVININNSINDTIKSLSHVRVTGEVVGSDDEIIPFSGLVNMTVFDKATNFITLNNDGFLNEPFEYILQKNIIYNGQADIDNGTFELEFIVPKDISYQYGQGKLSYYAFDNFLGEATGSHNNLYVGGVSDNYLSDLEGPIIQLYINDTNFVSGGFTNDNPRLLALLFDNSGINTVGTGIGHDLTVVLDQDIMNQHIVNDYYTSDINSYQSGSISYPFYNLSEGEHTLRLKAWDVHNNSSDAELTFFVTSSLQLAIEHMLNYPNPAQSFTTFVFEHNRPDDLLDIRVDIFSLSGQLIKTLTNTVLSTGFRNKSISWQIDDGIERGIYVYRLSVTSQNDNSIAEKTEKLIIVR